MEDHPKNLFVLPFCLLLFFWVLSFPRTGEARDPQLEEMGPIQEVASYLVSDTQQVYYDLSRLAGTHPQIDQVLPPLKRLNEKALQFYNRVMGNEKSPWRTTRSYKELNQAFVDAKEAFVQRTTYALSPGAFEEIAYLMGGLLQYYLYPPDAGPVYSYQSQPQVVYTWIPTFFTFSSCHRFPFWRSSPWSERVFW
jgi:hypothetical protein